jgi:CheY-like chemotaxis protein
MSSPVPDPLPLAVLFVDPDRAGAQLLANAIRDRYATAVVGSARKAYDAMRFQTPTLIVSSAHQTSTRRRFFLAHLRPSATRHILLMVVTSTRSLRTRRAFQAGTDDFLVKPVDLRPSSPIFSP